MKQLLMIAIALVASQSLQQYGQPFFKWLKGKLKTRRVKPLDCAPCLSFWLALILNLAVGTLWFWAVLGAAMAFKIAVRYERHKMR